KILSPGKKKVTIIDGILNAFPITGLLLQDAYTDTSRPPKSQGDEGGSYEGFKLLYIIPNIKILSTIWLCPQDDYQQVSRERNHH
ncbi:MAG: hypothetical protein U1A23_01760, partial [Candidatus Sungbacteria bacterium]|nr:hypothetical protein [Candidatus Sungbacteria bacterium]